MIMFRYIYVGALLWLSTQATCAYAWRLESGEVTTNDTNVTALFTTVTFQNPFDVTPVVVVVATDEGDESASLRIRNVTTTGFQVTPVEAQNDDGLHESMSIHYVAIEPGVHLLIDGTEIAAGIHSTASVQSKFATSVWDSVSFGTTLSATASVVASIQTMNSEPLFEPNAPSSPFMSATTRLGTTIGADMSLDRGEATTGTVVSEDIGWIAFPSGTNGTFLDTLNTSIGWDARITADTIVGTLNGGCNDHTFSTTTWSNPHIIGTKNKRDGGDGGWLRRCTISGTTVGLVIDEDIANDTDRAHTSEAAALLSFSDSFHASFDGKIVADKTVSMAPGTYSLPGEIISYTIAAESTGLLPIDADAVVLVDNLPAELSLRVVDLDGAGSGPITFNDGNPASGLTYTFSGLSSTSDDLDFSNDGGASFTYTPVDNGAGVDPNVTHIRVNPKGVFAARSSAGSPAFEITFDALIK